MKILSPYETVACKLISISSLEATYKKFITNVREEDLSYELYQGVPAIYFITGKTEEEKTLPILDFPLELETLRREPALVIDIRPYVNTVKLKDDFNRLSDIVRDKYAVNFLTLMGLLVYRMKLEGTILRPVQSTLITAFVSLCSAAIKKQSFLPPIDTLNVEIAIAIYAYRLLNPAINMADDSDRISTILSNCKYSLPVTAKQVKDTAEKLINTVNSSTVTGITYFKELLLESVSEDVKHNVDINVIYSALTNSWYGPGNTTAVYAALESMPVFTALMYSSISSSMYKRTKIAQVIDANKKKIDVVGFLKYMDTTVIQNEFKGLL